ncbi:hypothetical protein [Nocardia terpenica]|uniref:DUF8175 domain-containing protein n=1 Tax=Nocardia terpenica TaxID=455432 RepID=A0A6G9ZDX2_9NOCA|nr:hypothetical protein [Nocardia terpenica]QIS23640.1 hypothetical protein F6W96_40605 [Nocardia terpenica]
MSLRAPLLLAALAVLMAAAVTGCGRGHPDRPAATAAVNPTAAPAAAQWQSYRGVFVPYTDAGPSRVSGAAPTGYQDTPQGAVVAAMQGQARLALAPNDAGAASPTDAWALVAATVTAPGTGHDAYSTARVLGSITAEADPATTAQFAGFRIQDWSPGSVTVWLATRMPPTGQLQAQPTRLVWLGGDWKIALSAPPPPDSAGRVSTDPIDLANLNGYTEFHH